MAKTQPAPVPAAAVDARLKTDPHALHSAFQAVWQLLAHVREGTGGFLDGTFLIAHPREWKDYDELVPKQPTKKLTSRRNLACYENIAGTIIEAKKAALFRETPTRRFTNAEAEAPAKNPLSRVVRFLKRKRRAMSEELTGDAALLQSWWENVDGARTHIDDYMATQWDIGASFGHVFLYMDRPAGRSGATLADAQQPFLRVYTPLDAVSWKTNEQGRITEILFREPAEDQNKYTYRLVTEAFWAKYDESGVLVGGGPVDGQHQMGELPVVQLFAKRRALYRHIGQSVLGDPKLYQDLYNLTSEIRELLRNQTFSVINIPLGTGDQAMSAEQAKELLGGSIGAMNVIFSGQAAQILAGEAENVVVYHKEFERRLRTIYRLAAIQWEADSKDAEATGSLKLKREEMNTRLASYADELEKADYAVARLWFKAMRGADAGERAFEQSGLTIRYPDSFDMTPFAVVLEQAQAAMSLEFPRLVMNEIRKALLSKFLPDLDEETAMQLVAAIDAAEDQPQALDALRTRLLEFAGKKPAASDPVASVDGTAAA